MDDSEVAEKIAQLVCDELIFTIPDYFEEMDIDRRTKIVDAAYEAIEVIRKATNAAYEQQ